MKLAAAVLILVLSLVNNAEASKPLSTTSNEHIKSEVKKVLLETGTYTKDMYYLLLGTMAAESDFGRISKQVGGPALGPYQFEPATHKDLWDNYLSHKPELRKKVMSVMWPMVPKLTQLRYNLRYSTMLAVAQYQRGCDRKNYSMVSSKDPWSLAWQWKFFHNTKKGRGTTTHFFVNYKKHVLTSL